MSFYTFTEDDIINIKFSTYPSHIVELNGDKVTGSIYLESQFLPSQLSTRQFEGYSEKEGGYQQKVGPFSGSIDIVTCVLNGTNKQMYETVGNFYNFYSSIYGSMIGGPLYAGSTATTLRVVTIPEMYYEAKIMSSTFTASDLNSAGATRNIYDNGRGGLYSGSLTGTLVGHIFYEEGIAVLTKPDLTNFGSVSSTNFKWRVSFRGTNDIPCKIFKCRAPSGQLNATTNPSFCVISPSGDFKNEKKIIDQNFLYITHVGLFNEEYELVGLAALAQPIKKEINQDILFRLRLDF